ncbi:uncharacterized protein LOC129308226 [Prosopis cineraria]|uniref:uncharacterized protein LOC129308226 n=1 Tax=Prosopis cineraria TaxID=364024 RepID=UPI00240F0821|nr:uncharacterized protein LOC129308226 [Prosopis cineraria]
MNPLILLVFSLQLLSLLHSKSQGIRLEEGVSTETQNKHRAQDLWGKTNNGDCDDEEANLCKEVRNYNSTPGKKAKNKKLLVSTSIISSTDTIRKKANVIEHGENIKEDMEGEDTKVNWVATNSSKHQEKVNNEELVDITEMDYTAVKKKPPIHN